MPAPPAGERRALESLEPIPRDKRTWTAGTYCLMWAGISVQPSGFIFGAALLGMGLGLGEVALALVLGNVLLLGPLVLNALPGAKYGIPFPVLARSVFGRRGALAAVLCRGLVGVGWCGFNLWIGALALADVGRAAFPQATGPAPQPGHIDATSAVSLAVFTLLHVAALVAGVARLKPMLSVSPAVQSAGALAVLVWVFAVATPTELWAATEDLRREAGVTNSPAVRVLVGATAACSGWSTLALNIADLSRFARSQRDVALGQIAMFPLANVATPLLGALALGATRHCYGSEVTAASWNRTAMFRYWPPAVGAVAALVFALSVMTTNLVANVLSAANDFAAMTPRSVGFRGGGLIALAGGVALRPWSTFASASGFVNGFLVCYSIVTGAILGVMLVDYTVVRGRELSVAALYAPSGSGGAYEYSLGFSWRAGASMLVAVLPCLPGLVHVAQHGFSVGTGEAAGWVLVYDLAWPVTVVLSAAAHASLHAVFGPPAVVKGDAAGADGGEPAEKRALLGPRAINGDVGDEWR